jgi:hypothetical protein
MFGVEGFTTEKRTLVSSLTPTTLQSIFLFIP